jgi:two-component system, cell cycle sensor histidine kinase and response regulator CckA
MQGGSLGRTQTALQRKPPELEAILRALPDLFFRFDAEGRFLDYSAPSGSDLYAPPELFLGKRPQEVMPPELAQAMERARAETHACGRLVTLEYELEIGGGLQFFEARYVPFLDGQTIAMVRNISERRSAEAALRAGEARLRESQKIEAVGRLAGGVAHDFNNLLMIILCYVSVAARHLDAGHPAQRAIEEIHKATERATALTKQLLTLSRRQPMQPVVLDVREILRDMHSMLGRVLNENVGLSTEVDPELRQVLADRSQIEQVVLNLVLNARDAMPNGGQLRVSARNVPGEGESGPRANAAEQWVALCVSDTGSGMDAETRARMFEAFFTTKPRGTGLGLFTVQQIARENHGHLEVATEPGRGTRVELRLPAVRTAAASAAPERPSRMSRGNEALLVVEDEEAVRVLVVELLAQLGYKVQAAANAAEALAWLEREPAGIDMLLTDIVMPGLSGWELATAVLGRCPSCRVLYMSGHAVAMDDAGRPPVLHGELMHKPFTPEMLADRVRQTLDRGASAQSR